MLGRPEGYETAEEARAIIALSLVPGIGSTRIRTLIAHFNSAEDVFGATHKELSQIDGVGTHTARAIRAFNDFDRVQEQVDLATQSGARLVTYWSEEYPDLLRRIFDPPAFLWIRGRFPPEDLHPMAVVGTRNPSAYGKRVAEDLTALLVEQGFAIISGLAYGIDACAHKTALDAGGYTVGVLGSGVDRIYPARHKTLAEGIIRHGALLSELPLRAKPDAANFPRRNRIISGLSRGTLLVEAYEKGGALITARMAIEQNREVFAIPGSIYNKASEGMHRLIQRGHAKLVHSMNDILEELGIAPVAAPASKEFAEGVDLEALNPVERQLYEVMTHEPVQINQICEKTGLDLSTALVYLLSLEFKGFIYQMAGKQFYKAM